MSRRALCSLYLLTLASFALASPASANFRYHPTRLYGGVWLGFGGTVEVERVGPVGDLGKTFGGQFGFDRIVMPYLSLGGELRLGGFQVGAFDGRSRLIDIDFKPRLRLPLGESPLELYLTVPVGLTIPRLADLDSGNQLDENIGWNVGIGGGVNLFVTHRLAFNVEPIWLVHHFGTDGSDGNGQVKIKQFSVLLNAVFPL